MIISHKTPLTYTHFGIPAVVENIERMGLLTVMTGCPCVTCVITVAVKGGPGLRAFSSMFTVVRQTSN